jgi:dephospho-CoA kinase
MKRPLVVGICGGIGSGKSAAARVFERLGAKVIDADRIAHEVLTEPGIRGAVRTRFGKEVMLNDEVNRGALAQAVFGETSRHDEARSALQAIVHPRILARIEAELQTFRSAPNPPRVVIIDAPLLTETTLKTACDEIVFVEASEEARMARTRSERSWAPEHHRAREKAQASLDQRLKAASRVLVNNGSVEDLERACEALYKTWTAAS